MTRFLQPLKQFYCDRCGTIILKPEDGWVEWISELDGKRYEHSFTITHHSTCVPFHAPIGSKSYHLNHALELAHGFQLTIEPHPDHVREWRDWINRMTIPYYEQARFYFDIAASEDNFDPKNPRSYSEEFLREIIERYSEKYEDAA